tara:strand:- start:3501 stop:3602 length:102 start_codon:yes stop_codon:yes gene_type:complete
MEFDWRTINAKIDGRFAPKQIERQYGIVLIDKR